MDNESRSRIIKQSSIISAVGNAVLALLKIFIGLTSHSLALVGDGIDSATDIATSVLTFFTATIASEPPDREHPWGHERAETIATKLLSFIIFFAGAQLAVKSIENLISNVPREIPGYIAIYATLLSIVGKTILAIYKFRTGKKTQSSMLMADGKNMRNDIVISLTVFTGLVFSRIFGMPSIDSLIALAVSLWIMGVALSIFRETSQELMDSIKDHHIYKQIFETAERVEGVLNPHKMRIRKINRFYVVDLDVEVDGSMTVKEGHDIAMELDKEIRSSIDNIYDIMIHIEPAGAGEHNEKYGLKKEDLWETK